MAWRSSLKEILSVEMIFYRVWGLKWIFCDVMLTSKFKLVKNSSIDFFWQILFQNQRWLPAPFYEKTRIFEILSNISFPIVLGLIKSMEVLFLCFKTNFIHESRLNNIFYVNLIFFHLSPPKAIFLPFSSIVFISSCI